ncbi:hypothetical protein I3843_03G162300, partial [Carya illinoinensis]
VPADHTDQGIATVPQSAMTPNWIINVSDIRTVEVSNISPAVSEREIREFFSFSGDIQYVEMQRETDGTRLAYVTFKDSQGADTAVLLSGATIADFSVSITLVENYNLPPEAISLRLVNPIACSQLYLYICLSSRKIFTLELLMICECSGIVLTECELVLSYVLMRVMAIHRISDFKNTKCFCF